MSLGKKSPFSTGSKESSRSKEVTVMVAGRSGAGKSTALNNIFGLDLGTDTGSTSVTTEIAIKHLEKNGVILHIIDTPGLGAMDISSEKILKEMASQKIEGDFILLLCISVSPGNRLITLDETIIKNLYSIFGEKIWNNCFIIFTFSDLSSRHENDADAYKKNLESYCQSLNNIFRQRVGISLDFTTIYGYANLDHFNSKSLVGMVALPAGRDDSIETTQLVLPGLVWVEDSWADVVFKEIVKKASMFSLALAKLKHDVDLEYDVVEGVVKFVGDTAEFMMEMVKDVGKRVVITTGAVVGGVGGGIVGGGAGAADGAVVGAAHGAAGGAVVGAGVGALCGAGVGAGVGAAAGTSVGAGAVISIGVGAVVGAGPGVIVGGAVVVTGAGPIVGGAVGGAIGAGVGAAVGGGTGAAVGAGAGAIAGAGAGAGAGAIVGAGAGAHAGAIAGAHVAADLVDVAGPAELGVGLGAATTGATVGMLVGAKVGGGMAIAAAGIAGTVTGAGLGIAVLAMMCAYLHKRKSKLN